MLRLWFVLRLWLVLFGWPLPDACSKFRDAKILPDDLW
jgi:hypothetical protein